PEKTEPTKTDAATMPVAVSESLTGPIAQAFAREREVHVKVLVDPALLVVHEDWLGYVQRLFSAANSSFQHLFGISLRLHGVILWEQAAANTGGLLLDLAGHDREGADVVIGLVARPRPFDFDSPSWGAGENGGYALVFADLDLEERYYRGLLRAVAGLFGADPVRDQNSAAYLRGSFMSTAPVANESQPPWIDAENRDAVIANKQRPFAGPGVPTPEEPEDADDDLDAEPPAEETQ
ncbi:MAG: hypothetical protein KC431_25885, partial [Myxococcales bacterium]|nr:hypothetical protein [Myxococcales bacterium]